MLGGLAFHNAHNDLAKKSVLDVLDVITIISENTIKCECR